jgi:IclR family acetate operon transcriptional repressor
VKGLLVLNQDISSQDKKYEVKSLALALAVIEFVASAKDAGVSVSQVARTVSTPKSNAFRILQTLVVRGYLLDHGEGPARRYKLGTMFLRLANAATTQRPLADFVKPALHKLSQETNLIARFGILDRGYVVALAREDTLDGVMVWPYLGRQELAHCSAIGKALLSTKTDNQVREMLANIGLPQRTQRTITDWKEFSHELARTHARGFSIDDEEDFDGVFAVGAIVHDHTNQVVGAISACGLKLERSSSDLLALGKLVKRYAIVLSVELGASQDEEPTANAT